MKTPINITSTKSLSHSYDPQRFQHEKPDVYLSLISEREAETLGFLFADQDPWSRLGINPEHLRSYFSQEEEGAPRYAIWMARHLAGIVGLRLNWLKGPYLQFLGFLPGFQSLGLGSAAVTWLIGEARRYKEKNVWVCASSFNTKALSFYEKKGFIRVASLQGLVLEHEDEVLLRLRL